MKTIIFLDPKEDGTYDITAKIYTKPQKVIVEEAKTLEEAKIKIIKLLQIIK